MADYSTQDQQSTSAFRRLGSSSLGKAYPALPSYLSDIIRTQTEGSAPNTTLLGDETSLLSGMMSADRTALPYPQVTEEVMNMTPTDFAGRTALTSIAGQNPYSTDWESATGDLYDRTLQKGLAYAQTGPGNVRGGTARQGYAMADMNTQMGMNRYREIEAQKRAQSSVVGEAAQIANAIEASRRGTRMAAQQQAMGYEGQKGQEALGAAGGVGRMRQANIANVVMAADLLGHPTQVQTDNLYGEGIQQGSSSGWQSGIQCCFIFMEALNGKLPWYVRAARDEWNTPNRRAGYVWMSRWLCPAMRVWPRVMRFVNAVMIKPCLRFGRMHYITPVTRGSTSWWIARVPVLAWFNVWSFIGWLKKGKV